MERFVLWIYIQPLSRIILFILILVPFWALLMFLLRKHRLLVRILNSVLCLAAFTGILYATLFRGEGQHGAPILLPLYSLIEAQKHREMYRSLLMNVLLFVPFGLTLPYTLLEKWTCRALISIVIAVVISICIESFQFIFKLGCAEIDDVLMNTFGSVLGALAYLPYWIWLKLRESSLHIQKY